MMLADDRAQAFVSRLFFPWLELDKLGKSDPDKKYFPDYDVSLRDSLAKETELFLLSQLRDDRDPIELWSANYTFINEQLAKHYDIPNIIADIRGPQFRRVRLTRSSRPPWPRESPDGDIEASARCRRRLHHARYTGEVGSHTLPGSAPAESVSWRPAREARVAYTRPSARSAGGPLRNLPSHLLSAGLCVGELRSAGALAHLATKQVRWTLRARSWTARRPTE
jgi:hypothetical protein